MDIGNSESNKVNQDLPQSNTFQSIECHVCGAPAAVHLHYGAISCYSCRAFFRRGTPKQQRCILGIDNTCDINQSNRTNCKKCRYEKCLRIGMVPEKVDATKRKREEKKCQISHSCECRTSNQNHNTTNPNRSPVSEARNRISLVDEIHEERLIYQNRTEFQNELNLDYDSLNVNPYTYNFVNGSTYDNGLHNLHCNTDRVPQLFHTSGQFKVPQGPRLPNFGLYNSRTERTPWGQFNPFLNSPVGIIPGMVYSKIPTRTNFLRDLQDKQKGFNDSQYKHESTNHHENIQREINMFHKQYQETNEIELKPDIPNYVSDSEQHIESPIRVSVIKRKSASQTKIGLKPDLQLQSVLPIQFDEYPITKTIVKETNSSGLQDQTHFQGFQDEPHSSSIQDEPQHIGFQDKTYSTCFQAETHSKECHNSKHSIRVQISDNECHARFQNESIESNEDVDYEHINVYKSKNYNKSLFQKENEKYIETYVDEDVIEQVPLKKRQRMMEVPYSLGHAINTALQPIMGFTWEEENLATTYLSKIQYYHNKRFEFLLQTFPDYGNLIIAYVDYTMHNQKIPFVKTKEKKLVVLGLEFTKMSMNQIFSEFSSLSTKVRREVLHSTYPAMYVTAFAILEGNTREDTWQEQHKKTLYTTKHNYLLMSKRLEKFKTVRSISVTDQVRFTSPWTEDEADEEKFMRTIAILGFILRDDLLLQSLFHMLLMLTPSQKDTSEETQFDPILLNFQRTTIQLIYRYFSKTKDDKNKNKSEQNTKEENDYSVMHLAKNIPKLSAADETRRLVGLIDDVHECARIMQRRTSSYGIKTEDVPSNIEDIEPSIEET